MASQGGLSYRERERVADREARALIRKDPERKAAEVENRKRRREQEKVADREARALTRKDPKRKAAEVPQEKVYDRAARRIVQQDPRQKSADKKLREQTAALIKQDPTVQSAQAAVTLAFQTAKSNERQRSRNFDRLYEGHRKERKPQFQHKWEIREQHGREQRLINKQCMLEERQQSQEAQRAYADAKIKARKASNIRRLVAENVTGSTEWSAAKASAVQASNVRRLAAKNVPAAVKRAAKATVVAALAEVAEVAKEHNRHASSKASAAAVAAAKAAAAVYRGSVGESPCA
jgi:hypothetical protein